MLIWAWILVYIASLVESNSPQLAAELLLNGHLQAELIGRRGSKKATANDLYTGLIPGEWKAYDPELFSMLRENAGISNAVYEDNLSFQNLRCLSSDSKSGQAFWRSKSGDIVIKTIKHYECKNLRQVLRAYTSHVQAADSLIGNIVGLYRIKLTRGKTYYFLVCKNIYHQGLSAKITPTLKYDLKGSTVGRLKSANSTVYKDLDLISRNQVFALGAQAKEVLMYALQRDVHFLSHFRFMDYSLLVEVEEPQFNVMRRFFRHFRHPVSYSRYDRGKLVILGADGRVYHFGIIDFLQK